MSKTPIEEAKAAIAQLRKTLERRPESPARSSTGAVPETRGTAPTIVIEPPQPRAYECEITSRDEQGFIESFRISPVKP